MTLIQSKPVITRPVTNAMKAMMRTVLENQKGGFHLGSGTRCNRSCSRPNPQPQPQIDLLENQTISSRMTSIITTGNINSWRTRVDVSRLRTENTGLGFTPCLVTSPKANPKSNVPPMRKARCTFRVTL